IGFPARWPETALPAVAPGEFLSFYRERRATLNVWMMPVPVEEHLARARKEKSAPSEDVLKKLFDLYKSQVYDPKSDRPAFKEPERVKVEWVSAGPDLQYFKDLAKVRADLPEAFTKYGPRQAVAASVC